MHAGLTTKVATLDPGRRLHDAEVKDDQPRATVAKAPANSSVIFALANQYRASWDKPIA